MRCDFEDGICGFTQDQTDNFDFLRKQGQTPTVTGGPDVDQTYGNQTGSLYRCVVCLLILGVFLLLLFIFLFF